MNNSVDLRKYVVNSIQECISKNASKRESENENIIDFLIEKYHELGQKNVSNK